MGDPKRYSRRSFLGASAGMAVAAPYMLRPKRSLAADEFPFLLESETDSYFRWINKNMPPPPLPVYFTGGKRVGKINFAEETQEIVSPEGYEDGHGIMFLPDGRFVAVSQWHGVSALMTPDMKVDALIKSPVEEQGFSGHGAFVPQLGKIVFPLHATSSKRDYASKHEGENYIILVDPDKPDETPEIMPASGKYPHEIIAMPGGESLALSYYGRDTNLQPPEPFWEFAYPDAKLQILDPQSLKAVKIFIPEMPNQQVTHIAAGSPTKVYTGLWGNLLDEDVSREWLNEKYGVWHWPTEDGLIPEPSPVVECDIETGEMKSYMGQTHRHIRHQSAACHTQSGRIFSTYKLSNALSIVIPSEGRHVTLSMYDYGINMISGVSDIPGTPFVAVCDKKNGIYLIDAVTFELGGFWLGETETLHLACA